MALNTERKAKWSGERVLVFFPIFWLHEKDEKEQNPDHTQ
jgi:hypothetical protein